MGNIIRTDLIKTKQIKDRLCFYYWGSLGITKRTKTANIFSDKINYLLIRQNQILMKHLDILNKYPHLRKKRTSEGDFKDILPVIIDIVLRKIKSLIEEGKIPKKYSPTYIQIPDVYNKHKISKDRIDEFIQKYPFIIVVFKEQIISLIEQKFQNEEMQSIARLLKELNSHSEGIDFDEYIDAWSKEIMSELKSGSIQNIIKKRR